MKKFELGNQVMSEAFQRYASDCGYELEIEEVAYHLGKVLQSLYLQIDVSKAIEDYFNELNEY